MKSTYVIIGGGVAGTTAASTIRRMDADGTITVVSSEAEPLYSRLSLSAFTRGQTTKEQIYLRQPEFYRQKDISLKLDTVATAVDTADQIVTLADGQKLGYEKLLLAGGSWPRAWAVPGAELKGVLPLRTLSHAEQIAKRLPKVKHALVIGGSFISLEQIQTLSQLGIATTVVLRDPYVWASVLDEESGQLIAAILEQAASVRILYRTEVEVLEGATHVEAALLSNGQRLLTDLVLVNIGVDPMIAWLEGSGIALDGGVVTDEFLQTSAKNVWAAGDIALFNDKLLGAHHRLGNWSNAAAQGETAGLNMTQSKPTAFEAVSTYSISLFGKNISFVGDFHMHARMTAIPRGSARSGAYGRMMMRNNVVVGATLINRFADRQPIEELIKAQIPLNRRDVVDLTDESVPLDRTVRRLVKAG